MKHLSSLYHALDATTKTGRKVDVLVKAFTSMPSDDVLWSIALLLGKRPRRICTTTELRQWATMAAQISPWLFDECYAAVGDLAETIAMLVHGGHTEHQESLAATMASLEELRKAPDDVRAAAITDRWQTQTAEDCLVFNKLLTGGFRVGVSRGLVVRALAAVFGADEATITHRLMGNWTPNTITLDQLMAADSVVADTAKPYPFCLASPLDVAPEHLGLVDEYAAEWKWDGIRAQLIYRGGRLHVWSRGEELITDRFPELDMLCGILPDPLVLDGELLAMDNTTVLPFAHLQKRISRRTISAAMVRAVPVRFMAYDVLEHGYDCRHLAYHERRRLLETIVEPLGASMPITISPTIQASEWSHLEDARQRARALGTEGLMLKRRDAPYQPGRTKGVWWKWKVEPYTVDAVMIYAQAGHGNRASQFTDYTFAIWKDGALVPFAKAYSGLTKAEIARVDAFVKANTKERFGPVRTVVPSMVFELAFEGLQRSARHKSGVAVRFPRIVRIRDDKTADQADSHQTILAMLDAHEQRT